MSTPAISGPVRSHGRRRLIASVALLLVTASACTSGSTSPDTSEGAEASTPTTTAPQLVVERRAITASEQDRIEAVAELNQVGAEEGWANFAPLRGWTELTRGEDDSIFVHRPDNLRFSVSVGGDAELGVWRVFSAVACEPVG